MRLNERQANAIRESAREIFGADAVVRLFGSRVDDTARGGDIDLHIESSGSPTDLLDRELRLRVRLQRQLGERHIDVVVHARGRPLRPIDEQARQTGLRL